MNEQQEALAKDIAQTILHFRGVGEQCFATTCDMKETIQEEVRFRGANNVEICIMTESLIKDAGEWYDKEDEE